MEIEQNQAAIDIWFERHTADLTQAQQADLKNKYARASTLNNTEQVIYMRAFDISTHYRENLQGTQFKAQLVAPSKAAAIKYHQYLQEIGNVTSRVIISAPDKKEIQGEAHEKPTAEMHQFWQAMMREFGSEDSYNTDIINSFKDTSQPEILIVVDKLLTGFDAPVNMVMYLCRPLRDHTLLQAIARVNRLHDNKDYGYIIDYASTLGELDKALTMYDAFEGFDEEDLADTLTSINAKVQQLPQCYSDLWDIFKKINNKNDEEAFERHLADDKVREDFYEAFTKYGKCLSIALSSNKFVREIDTPTLKRYKNDLKYFYNLKTAVKLRYAEAIDYRDYEPKIQKLLDTHIQANEVTQLNAPVNIFDEDGFDVIKQGQGIYSNKTNAAKADIIAHATKKIIHEKMEEDPAFYKKFSEMIQQVIDDFKSGRISETDYLDEVSNIRHSVVSKHRDNVPEAISDNDEACAYYGAIVSLFKNDAMHLRFNHTSMIRPSTVHV